MPSKGKIPKARLEMTSLMDVMFLVLVFFIYCIFDMSVHHGVKVDLPQAAGALERGERIVITISRDGSLALNGKVLAEEALVGRLAALKAAGGADAVIIAGDRNAPLGCGVRLLAALKQVGLAKVSYQVTGDE